jgi:pimeloyl-ACP methyl ester carboxylesterase
MSLFPTQNDATNIGLLTDTDPASYIAAAIGFLTTNSTFGCSGTTPGEYLTGAGGCNSAALDEAAAQYVGFAVGSENAVENYTSVIPGIERTSFERHFNFTANESLQPTPMSFAGGFGSSGSLFINLQGFINSRDKNRQGAVDLLNVIQSLGGIDVNGDTVPDFDTTNVFLAGHSLGTVMGTGAVAAANQSDVVTDVKATALFAPASGIVRMLENSPSFAPTIIGGLAAAGVQQGTSSYETFLNVFQHAIDSADPINLADDLVEGGNGVITFNVVGTPDGSGGTLYESDETNVMEASATQLTSPFGIKPFKDFLAGAIPFSEALGAVNVVDTAGGDSFLASNLAYGSHSMFVLPSSSDPAEQARQADAFSESMMQTIEFFTVGGGLIGPVDATNGRSGATTTPIMDTTPLGDIEQLN